MYRQCRHCGFKNPPDIGECLVCKKDLPTTVGEFKEGVEALTKAVKGDWSGVAKKGVDEFVGDRVTPWKYRFHPIWFLKIKLHRLRMILTDIFWVFAIIGAIVIIGLIYNFLSGLFR